MVAYKPESNRLPKKNLLPFLILSKNGIVFYYTDEHFIKKRTSYRLDCAKILIAFPSINARWLLLGEGDMKLTKRNSFSQE